MTKRRRSDFLAKIERISWVGINLSTFSKHLHHTLYFSGLLLLFHLNIRFHIYIYIERERERERLVLCCEWREVLCDTNKRGDTWVMKKAEGEWETINFHNILLKNVAFR